MPPSASRPRFVHHRQILCAPSSLTTFGAPPASRGPVLVLVRGPDVIELGVIHHARRASATSGASREVENFGTSVGTTSEK